MAVIDNNIPNRLQDVLDNMENLDRAEDDVFNAQKKVENIEGVLSNRRTSLREFIGKKREITVDLDGTIYCIKPDKNSEDDVIIQEIKIDYKKPD